MGIALNILVNGLYDDIMYEVHKNPDLTTDEVIDILSGNTRLTDAEYFHIFMTEHLYKYSKDSFGYDTSETDTIFDDIMSVVDIHIEECVLNKLRMDLRELKKKETV